jgi:SAM-dependent methyltransferase
MIAFQKYAQYYDLLYADKNYDQEAVYVDALIQQHKPRASIIVDFGCGTGRHAVLLANKGYNVHGVDLSSNMIDLALQRARQEHVSFGCADIRTVDLGRTFDVVISLFHVMSYQVSNEDMSAVFARAYEHLLPGGVFIFDAWYGPAVLTERPSVRVKRMEHEDLKVVRIAEPLLQPERNCVDVTFTVFFETKKTGLIETFTEKHVMRYLFVPEIEQLCMQHGFELMMHEEWLTAKPLSCSTWGACFVCKKR